MCVFSKFADFWKFHNFSNVAVFFSLKFSEFHTLKDWQFWKVWKNFQIWKKSGFWIFSGSCELYFEELIYGRIIVGLRWKLDGQRG